ncbi:MAG: hypothetical protein MZU95_12310 [Desulfomicrobium escambiense]|nr:hypothetical protein [Desulfomicrobium escambiense]
MTHDSVSSVPGQGPRQMLRPLITFVQPLPSAQENGWRTRERRPRRVLFHRRLLIDLKEDGLEVRSEQGHAPLRRQTAKAASSFRLRPFRTARTRAGGHGTRFSAFRSLTIACAAFPPASVLGQEVSPGKRSAAFPIRASGSVWSPTRKLLIRSSRTKPPVQEGDPLHGRR